MNTNKLSKDYGKEVVPMDYLMGRPVLSMPRRYVMGMQVPSG